MDISKLKAFLVCCEEMNYTKAAVRLFISRQALRQTIQSLETELGTTLFSNLRNRLSLTASGETVRNYAEELTRTYESMLMEVSAVQGKTLRLGISCSLLPFFSPELPGYLEEFGTAHPELPLELLSLTTDQTIEKVLSGELTAAILVMMDWDIPGIAADTICRFPFGVTFAETHRFSRKKQIGIEDLAGEKCVVWGSPELIMRPLYEELQKAGVQISVEVIPSAKTAFYLMENENRLMFEYTYPNTKQLQVERNSPLAGSAFSWSLTLIHKSQESILPLTLLKDFLIAKYDYITISRNIIPVS
ncbi:LysR family transcriptional regulator [Desulfitobacterium hafniense]|uniref:LysR family transcriptional regulator n=1 Tax=Desulfitobacterium hafniense TaxID=49338 RepID=UPI000380E9AE|nr:LysR family transcriptional regulator [Desulfitobacterium hafniense]